MEDCLYETFYDPQLDFAKEPRAFCYELATDFISNAKKAAGQNWYEDINTKKGVLLLLFTWNFAAPITKKLTFDGIGRLLKLASEDLRFLEPYSITTAGEDAWGRARNAFDVFAPECGQTGASKALSLLNPQLFVMWDTAIRKRLNKGLIRGIGNGESGEQYVILLKGVQGLIKKYNIAAKVPVEAIAKKFDEYNFVQLVMNKKRPSTAGGNPMNQLSERFDQRLRESVRLAIELGYNPTVFTSMLERHGAVQTAKRLIAAGELQSGIKRLAELGRLDITMEQIMLEPEFAPLFAEGELAAARWRLDQLS
jgi:hypothetical protein